MATAFSGTQAKCKACQKKAYPMEQTVAEGIIFHKTCFRCSHCSCILKLNNFTSLEGVFYCKPHFEQLFHATGSFSKSFNDAIKAEKEIKTPPESLASAEMFGTIALGGTKNLRNPLNGIPGDSQRSTEKKGTPSSVASKFEGTQDRCRVCAKTVYPIDKVNEGNISFHKGCFKCTKGGCTLSPANYKTHAGNLYCKHHFSQLLLVKGQFSTLESGECEARSASEVKGGDLAAPVESEDKENDP